MMHSLLFIFCCYSFVVCTAGTNSVKIPEARKKGFQLVDTIVARVNGTNVMLSDLVVPSIMRDGAPLLAIDDMKKRKGDAYRRALEEAIDEHLLFLRALERKMAPTQTDIEKQMVSLKTTMGMVNMPDDEFDKVLRKEGLTLAKYHVQLHKALAIERLKQAEVSERSMVTSQEAEAYYQHHKQMRDEVYTLKIATVSKKLFTTKPSKKELLQHKELVWQQLDPITKSDLAQHLSFVSSMKEGEISSCLETDHSYQLIMLINKQQERYRSLEESYIEIEKKLQEQKRQDYSRVLMRELRSHALIVYL